MRVIAGMAKGKRLKAPKGTKTRPITDMIKEALFNVIGLGIDGAYLLDLFAGSGSVGIEALSRNAHKVVFVDSSIAAVKAIEYNLQNCNFHEKYEIHRQDVFKSLDVLSKRKLRFDYIYIDPPFSNDTIIGKVLHRVDKADIISAKGSLIIRTHRRKVLPDELFMLKRYRISHYGESTLHYYWKHEEEKADDGDF